MQAPRTPFPMEKFLSRIGILHMPRADAKGLGELHRAFLKNIPFENIDPFLHRKVSLREEALWQKIILGKRGGYCFELNSIFSRALEELGFAVRPVLGRVFMGRTQAGPRTHLASIVEIAGREWLADVGFGGPGIVDPIPFESYFSAEQAGRKIRLRADRDWGMVYEDEFAGDWRRIYALPKENVVPIDVEAGNHFASTYPESTFRNNLFCARLNGSARITVWNREVHVLEGDRRTEQVIARAEDLARVLRESLGLVLEDAEISAVYEKLPALIPA